MTIDYIESVNGNFSDKIRKYTSFSTELESLNQIKITKLYYQEFKN